MKLFVCIHDDARLLPHFLRHYAKAGISEFHIAVSAGVASETRALAPAYPIVVYEGLDVAATVTGGVGAVAEMRRRAQGPDEWVLIVDLDEFVKLPPNLGALLDDAEADGANVVRGIMYDRFPESGGLVGFDDQSDLWETYPVRARFTRDVMGATDCKGVLVKGHLSNGGSGGHHFFKDERIHWRMLEIAHFKWNDRSIARMRIAYERVRQAGHDWSVDYKNSIDHFDAHGRFAWETFGGAIVGKDDVVAAEGARCELDLHELEVLEMIRESRTLPVAAMDMDCPRPGSVQRGTFLISGWMVAKPGYTIRGVKVYCNEILIGRSPLDVPRPDVAAHYAGHPYALLSGFRITGDTAALPENPAFRITAEIETPARAAVQRPLAELRGVCRAPRFRKTG